MAEVRLKNNLGVVEGETPEQKKAREDAAAAVGGQSLSPVVATPAVTSPVQETPQAKKAPVFGSREYYQQQGQKANSALDSFSQQIASIPTAEKPTYRSLSEVNLNPSDYEYNQNFVNEYFEKPLTEAELRRRERAAYASDGVLNLGNAIGALGNLAFVAGGAAPQALPTVPDTDAKVNAMRDRADRVRQAWLNAKLAGRKADRDELNQERNYRMDVIKGDNANAKQAYDDERGANQDEMRKYGALAGIAQGQAGQAQQGIAHQDQLAENEKARAIQWANLRETQAQNQWTRNHADSQETTPIMLQTSDTSKPAVYGRLLNTGINDFNRKQIGRLIVSPEEKAEYEAAETQINKLLDLDKATATEMEKPENQSDIVMLSQLGNQRKQYRDAIAAYNNQINGIVVNACAKPGNAGLQRYLVESGLIVSKNGTLSWENEKPKGEGNGSGSVTLGLK